MVKDGDKIVVDAASRTIEWLVDDATKLERQKEWTAEDHPLKVRRGVLFRYARDVAVSLKFAENYSQPTEPAVLPAGERGRLL